MSQQSRPTVLVGTDGSDPSCQALMWAARYADRLDGSLQVILAWEPPTVVGFGFPTMTTPPTDLPAEMEEEVRTRAQKALHNAGFGHLPVTVEIRQGNAAQVLLDASPTADLIVLGRHGHRGFASAVMGSVSARVTAHAACPVVVVPHRRAD